MRIAIDARVTPERGGGVAPFLKSLVGALGQLSDGDEEYVVVVGSEKGHAWLKPVLGPRQRLQLYWGSQSAPPRGMLGRLRFLRPAVRYARRFMDSRVWPEVPLSDGFFESLGCDVLHVALQSFTVYAMPTIYNPHDLQHRHYPQYMDAQTIAWRERIYRAGCDLAHTVVVGSQWIKDDVIRQFGVPADKLQVIPEAASTQPHAEPTNQELTACRAKYGLDERFAFYPSVTWPHKNHLRLFEALALLRDERGLTIPLVCSGARYEDFWPRIAASITNLRLEGQVKFLGHVPETDLRALYRLSTCLVLPTLFEAVSLPVFEAWAEGVPVACSNATALPEQVKDAAYLFDPMNVASIADAVANATTREDVRERLRSAGYRRAKDFDWSRTARAYRAVYRRTAGRTLAEEDRYLLGWNWMLDPQREHQPGAL